MSAIAIVMVASCGVLATCAAAQPVANQGRSAPRITVTMPDSMSLSVRGPVPVSTHLDGIIKVKNAEPSPWWDSNMFSAFLGALVGGLLAVMSQAAGARLALGLRHRNTLVRLERICHDLLNEIISNKSLAADAKAAAAKAAVFWHLPNRFDVDKSFTMDIIDIDLVNRVGSLNTNLTRYNHDLEHLGQARESLQSAYLAVTLPQADWEKAMHLEAPHWDEIAVHLDAVDGMVRDVCVRAVLLVGQYDGRRARLLRFFGLGVLRTWPLSSELVAKERQAFDERRNEQLKADRKRLAEVHGPPPPKASTSAS